MSLRDKWPSRTAFIYAAIGSAVGLGNIWRFPFLAEKFGGGAFLIPFLIALFVAGIPLLILEFALGQKIQKGAVDSLASIKKKLSGVGWWALFTAFIVISYYVVIMAWSLIYLFTSFGVQWSENPEGYFNDNVLQKSEELSSTLLSVGGIVPSIFISLLVCWILIYFCVWKGIKSVSKIVMWTVPLPIILLIVLLIRAFTLDGAMVGIAEYITPDFSAIFDAEVWIAAVSQVFFSLSIAFGVMIAYSSYNKKGSDINKNAFTVGIADTVIAIIAGFVVFGTLGFMAEQQGVAFDEVVASGPGLAFVAFPKALSLMPFASLFGILFFLTLLTLAIDSAFSLVEAIATTIKDKTKISKEKIAFIVCFLCFLAGIIYTTNAGLYLLDVVDHFLTNISLIVIGILECIAVGWIFGAEKMRKYINKVSDFKIGTWWNTTIKYIIPISLAIILALQLKLEFIANYEGYPDWAILIGWLAVLVPLVIAFLIPQKMLSKDKA
ncbi:sodium-dependent transporter [Candidatus Woesearchaeota archaeon]|jgi:NSS family neurotransmitter:Na+ symporter|nr:sodium-dependent transporter [Candidatus Woesearchaeota archaeon]